MKPNPKPHSCQTKNCPVCYSKEEIHGPSVEALKKQVLELVTNKPEKAAIILEQWLKTKR